MHTDCNPEKLRNMKTRHYMKSLACALGAAAAMLLALTGCQKEFELDLPLAVSSRNLSLTKEAGSTHVLVYSTGAWKARLTRNVIWASLDRQEGYGNNEIVFTYSANYGISRKVGVIFDKDGLTDTVMFSQAGNITDPQLAFASPAVTLLKSEADILAPLNTNLRYSVGDMEASVSYYGEDGQPGEPVPVLSQDGEIPAQTADHWVTGVSVSEEGVSFSVSENSSSLPRIAELILSIADAEDNVTQSTLSITQGIAGPQFKLESTEGRYEGFAQECSVMTTANNITAYSDKVEYSVEYSSPVAEGEEWIIDPVITSEGLQFSLSMNTGAAERSAVISLDFTDGAGETVSASYTVVQSPYPAAVSFEEVRSMTPGEIDLLGYIEGYVVSDPESQNIVSSPQTAQFQFDRTENGRTVYLESTDGKYGFCLKFVSEEENTLERFSKVRLSIDGAVLQRKDDPECYTITGLTAANILEAAAPDEFRIPVKTRRISELTDDDIFTLVSVSGLEIMCKDGAYTNCTDGYSLKDDLNAVGTTSPRWDVAPLMCYDNTGETIFMLTNAGASWRRFSSGHDLEFGTLVPQGSGTFRGILVSDDVAPVRFGDLGRYQLRAMTESEIALDEEPFSKTIAEWNWNDREVDLIPETGEGEIDIYDAKMAGSPDFNNVVCSGNGGSSSEQKGLVANGAVLLTRQWWDFSSDEGRYFDISFSTAGISGSNMFLGIVWGHGQMNNTTLTGPSHWNLLYSTDGGASFSHVPGSDVIKKRSIVWWSGTSQDSTPGYTEHLRKLPSDCFGKEKVILRLQVADKVTDIDPKANSSNYLTALGIEKGMLTESVTAANCPVRIGTITLRYN